MNKSNKQNFILKFFKKSIDIPLHTFKNKNDILNFIIKNKI